MTNTRPVPNLQSPLVGPDRKVIPPWNSWFQQFTQNAPAIVSAGTSPYTANQNGTVIIKGGVGIVLTRGSISITLANGQAIIPISIGDTVSWTSATSVQFLGS